MTQWRGDIAMVGSGDHCHSGFNGVPTHVRSAMVYRRLRSAIELLQLVKEMRPARRASGENVTSGLRDQEGLLELERREINCQTKELTRVNKVLIKFPSGKRHEYNLNYLCRCTCV